MNIETVPTGSISLDIALGLGGVPKGRVVEVYGPESSGKTTVEQKNADTFNGHFYYISPSPACKALYGIHTVKSHSLFLCKITRTPDKISKSRLYF